MRELRSYMPQPKRKKLINFMLGIFNHNLKKKMAYRALALTSIPPKIPFNDRKKYAF